MASPRSDIPFLRVSGGHRQVGRQLGEACAEVVRRSVDLEHVGRPAGGRAFDDVLAEADRCRSITGEALPWLLEELEGVAEGAGVDVGLLFAASMEELWDDRPSQPSSGRGCTDVLVGPPSTAHGHTLVAHNNDLPPDSEADVIAVEWDVPGDPLIFTIGVGPWISVGWNAAGLSLTGNEVTPNDERPGIPRLLLVRAQLRASTLEEAVGLAAHPQRASAYNTVFATSDGQAVDVEASATACECVGPDARGRLVHTNHYVTARMHRYEGDPAYAVRSERRRLRALALLDELEAQEATVDRLQRLLSDHANGADAICRHVGEVTTVFWCVADVTDRRITYGRGNPCRSASQVYEFS